VLTAVGVFAGMRAAAQVRWGAPTLAGRLVGISGVGKVGRNLTPLLLEDGADVVVTDVDHAAVERLTALHPGVRVAQDTAKLLTEPLDVFSPCALGHALTPAVVAALSSGSVVCGGANNQLPEPGTADALAARDVLYCPDFCVNAGGVIQVADELRGFSFARARARTERIFDTTLEVLTSAAADGVSPAVAADRLAERRIAEVSALRRIHLR
jgi:valine dehydrogenase (NAD+)